jgi:hypothetical protein
MEDQLLDLQKEDLDDIQQILNATPMPILSGDGAVIESVMSDEVWLAEQAKIAKKMEDDRKKKEQIDTENKTHEAIDALRKTFSNSNIKEGGE